MRLKGIKRWDKIGLLLMLAASVGALAMVLFRISEPSAPKWLATAGQLLTIAGVFQLEVAGLFDRIFEQVSDVTKFPYGPPSHITREIIDNPDRPVTMFIESWLFFRLRTGFWLIITGTLLQVWATWL